MYIAGHEYKTRQGQLFLWGYQSQASLFQNKNHDLFWGHVDLEMFCQMILSLVSFAALIALEGPLPCVRHHVPLQMVSLSRMVVALVTLKWVFSWMLSHDVAFQMSSWNAWILAHCASVRLFSRVGPFVLLEIARLSWSVVALIALMWFLSSVFLNVLS